MDDVGPKYPLMSVQLKHAAARSQQPFDLFMGAGG